MNLDLVARIEPLLRRQLELGLGGLLLCVPLAEDAALPRDVADAAIAQAIIESEAAGIHGPASTPWVLDRVAQLTNGASIRANLALIEHNAAVAAEVAVALGAV